MPRPLSQNIEKENSMQLTKEKLNSYKFRKVSHLNMENQGVCNYTCIDDSRIKMQVVTPKKKNGEWGTGKKYIFFLGSKKDYPIKKIDEFIKDFNEHYGKSED